METKSYDMDEWKTAGVGVGGLLATITLSQWSLVASASAATLTTIYMACKLWKDMIKPWLKERE